MLRRDLLRVVWGVTITHQAANVYLITMGGLSGRRPVISGHAGEHPNTSPTRWCRRWSLTAIVIGFGTTAFALVLTYRIYEEHGTIDLEELGVTRRESESRRDRTAAGRARHGHRLAARPAVPARPHAASASRGALAYLASVVVLAERVCASRPSSTSSAWRAPFGITLVADALSVFMLAITAVVSLAAVVFSIEFMCDHVGQRVSYHPLYHFLLVGVTRRLPHRRPLQPLRLVRGDAPVELRPRRLLLAGPSTPAPR